MILEKGESGFLCQFGEGRPPYRTTDDGAIIFSTEEGLVDSREQELSVHALRRPQIQYILTPRCKCDKDTLAARFYAVAAENRGGGRVFFRYCADYTIGN